MWLPPHIPICCIQSTVQSIPKLLLTISDFFQKSESGTVPTIAAYSVLMSAIDRKLPELSLKEKPHVIVTPWIYLKPEALIVSPTESMRSLCTWERGFTHQYDLMIHLDVFGGHCCVCKCWILVIILCLQWEKIHAHMLLLLFINWSV